MPKGIRVYELARELDIKSQDILDLLAAEMNIELNNHMASVNDTVAAKVRRLVKDARRPAQAAAQPAPAGGAATEPAAPGKAEAADEAADGDDVADLADDPRLDALAREERIRRQKAASDEARRDGRADRLPRTGPAVRPVAPGAREIELNGPVVVGDLAKMLGLSATDLIRRLMSMGVMAAINQQVDLDTATRVAADMGVQVRGGDRERARSALARAGAKALLAGDDPERAVPRAPVVTVLGHVDHGKTTLLDAIRSTRVAQGEAGGITQHIGASVVEWQGKRIVFLDTPGHEAFTAMRARGAQITDVAVLVVAADDGVMPQTVEAISHAKSAGVPIIVAMNKMDKEGANPDRLKQQLADHDLLPEDWGGDTIVVPVSAVKGEGIGDLLEMIQLVAEIQELKADPKRRAVGTVIEAELDRGRGPVATVLVQSGTLRRGDTFVAGSTWGKVRAMVDDRGKTVKEAGPSTPVSVLGFTEVPLAGDVFEAMPDEKTAREVAASRQADQRESELRARKPTTLAEFRAGEDGPAPELRLVVKADVSGSLEAIRGSIEKIRREEAYASVIHAGVGGINASDVMLAATSGAVVLGFNVRPDAGARQAAEREGVEIKTYRVIYDLVDDVREALGGMLKPKVEEVSLGFAEVRQTFRVPGGIVIAGCYVQEGSIRRGASARIVRDGVVVHEGRIASLRRFKDDVREVAAGYECGIGFERFNDVKEGDVIETYESREVAR